MPNYIDGYVFPILQENLDAYKSAAEKIAAIWKEHGALSYSEYVSDGLAMDGIPSFHSLLETKANETVVFGWIVFESREARDLAHERVSADKRMTALAAPLMDSSRLIFDASKMVFGGFQSLIKV